MTYMGMGTMCGKALMVPCLIGGAFFPLLLVVAIAILGYNVYVASKRKKTAE
jgi:general stress protein CsbA